MKEIALHWLGETPIFSDNVTFGIPFASGEVEEKDQFIITNDDGEVQVQTWPMAYWADGSVKWFGIAANQLGEKSQLKLVKKEEVAEIKNGIRIEETEENIILVNNELELCFPKQGNKVINSIKQSGKVVCTGVSLNGTLEERIQKGKRTLRSEVPFESVIKKVDVEQVGAIRSVIKVEGMHQICDEERTWLPFNLRFIIFKDSKQVEITHNFIFDGDANKDFIKALGMSWSIPMASEVYNRQLKYGGDTGMFAENCQFISRRTKNYENIYKAQVEGGMIHVPSDEDWIQDMAVWQHYKLNQTTNRSYVVQKTAKNDCAYIEAAHGEHAKGSVYVGDETKGFMVSMKDFWQKCPAQLEVRNLGEDTVDVHTWFWSPDHNAMDMRHYDTETHVESSYEGAHELDSTPYGIGNTHELTMVFFSETADNQILFEYSKELQNKKLLLGKPSVYKESKAFGIYSLVDRSTPTKAFVEDQLNQAVSYYIDEVKQRSWYGFWHYGDVMHTYDPIRHQWRYDLGGFAWQNTELAPNMWLWYMFLRTQDLEIFRLAEAMTRHTSEVDVYHLGDYKGLGSRHNVIHWGCGAKEARIAMAGLHRYYYYLTADERVGEIMDEVVNADYSTLNKDPMREYYKDDGHKTHARSGPDWAAYSSNWFTKWERTKERRYLDKIMTGVDSLYNMPHKMLSGSCFGYDPETGVLSYMGEDTYGYHLAICMGEPEVWMEMAEQLDDSRLKEMLVEFGDFYYLSHEEKKARTEEAMSKDWDWPMFATDIAAYAARENKDTQLAKKVWHLLLEDKKLRCIDLPIEKEHVVVPYLVKDLYEIPTVTTNTFSQWCLNTIVCLELVGDYLPEMGDWCGK